MSVLVWDGKTLATDSFANNGNTAFPVEKLWRAITIGKHVGDTLFGAIGNLKDVSALREWSDDMMAPWPEACSGTLVLVTPEKGLTRYRGNATPILHGINKVAFGEGADVAYGALHMGATAKEAVEAAIKYNIHCNGEAVTLGV